MEQFKASEEDWQLIEKWLDLPHANLTRAVVELRDRVAALEAAPDRVLVRNQIGEYVKPRTPVYANSLVSHSIGTAKPIEECGKDHIQVLPTTVPTPPAAVPSDRVLWEVQLEAKTISRPHIGWQVWSPESEPLIAAHRALYNHGFQHGLAAGRAEQGTTPEPEPSQAPAGDGGLVEKIRDLLGHQFDSMARTIIRTVAKWLRSRGNHGSAAELEQEAQR
jgi:hypothetical protein